jgi:dTDP-4-amino-4,6-dideoxygalactose transaminase
MTAPPIQLSEAWFDAREADRIARALAGRVAGNGPFCLTTSCTHAMELALLALGVGPGDEVICPSSTFIPGSARGTSTAWWPR